MIIERTFFNDKNLCDCDTFNFKPITNNFLNIFFNFVKGLVKKEFCKRATLTNKQTQ